MVFGPASCSGHDIFADDSLGRVAIQLHVDRWVLQSHVLVAVQLDDERRDHSLGIRAP